MSFEPEEVSLKLDRPLTRVDVENLLHQQTSSETLDLSGQNLAVINFAGLDLSGADFNQTHLNGANLREARLERVNLSEARLNGAKGHKVRLDQANLQGASLIEAKLDEASFHKAQLNQANLSGADLRKADLSEANLSEADLSETDLSGADLSRACLFQANLSRAILHGTDLSEADLRESSLGGAKLDGARLDKSNLSQVRLVLVNLREAKMGQANLSQADLSWSDLRGANLARTDLRGASLVETDLNGADLREATLTGANFSGANLSEARLIGADLAEVNLSGANLSGAYLSEQQRALLEPLGDVLGLAEARSAQDLLELEEALNRPEEPPNGLVTPAEMDGIGYTAPSEEILEAAANLPALAPDPDQPLTSLEGPGWPPHSAEPDSQNLASPAERLAVKASAAHTLNLLVKERPLRVYRLVKLLAALEELHCCFSLIEQGRLADLVEFHRSPDQWPERPGLLTVKNLYSDGGELELTCGDTANPPAILTTFRFLVAGLGEISRPVKEDGGEKTVRAARLLAKKVLQSLSPGLAPDGRVMAAQILLVNIVRLAEGPPIELVGSPPGTPPEAAKTAGWPSWVQD